MGYLGKRRNDCFFNPTAVSTSFRSEKANLTSESSHPPEHTLTRRSKVRSSDSLLNYKRGRCGINPIRQLNLIQSGRINLSSVDRSIAKKSYWFPSDSHTDLVEVRTGWISLCEDGPYSTRERFSQVINSYCPDSNHLPFNIYN